MFEHCLNPNFLCMPLVLNVILYTVHYRPKQVIKKVYLLSVQKTETTFAMSIEFDRNNFMPF